MISKNRRNNKQLFAGIFLAIVGIIGGCFAYFTSTKWFKDASKVKPYVMEVTDMFESPLGWTPGTTSNKKVVATNKGDAKTAVRIKLTESWVDANGNPLPLTDNDNVNAAIINFASDLYNKWAKSGDYYYYRKALSKNESTSSLLDSVTFNPLIEETTEDSCVTDEMTNITTCTTNTTGYASGYYTLVIDVESVQYDQYKSLWDTNVSIAP